MDQKIEILSQQPKELSVIADKIQTSCVFLHKKFDDTLATIKESFHNHFHVEATIKASDALVDAAIKSKDGDPLELQKDLDEWNESQNINPNITLEEFKYIAQIAFATHDLGNIAKYVYSSESGLLAAKFHQRYRFSKAEDRSQLMVRSILTHHGLDQQQIDRYSPLIKQIIKQTEFAPDETHENQLFGKFARVCDQIGNKVFNQYPLSLEKGLLNEKLGSQPDSQENPHWLINFTIKRLPQLVDNPKAQDQIIDIFEAAGGHFPDLKTIPDDLENKPYPVTELLEHQTLFDK